MFHVYILFSLKDLEFYTGFTENLKRRFSQHASGNVESTKNRRPLKLVYYEAYLLKEDAEAREKYLKTSDGKRDIKRQLKKFIEKHRK